MITHCSPLGPLLPGDIHIAQAALMVSAPALHEFSAILSEEERQRAAQFHFDLHRNRFIAARGKLRVLLGDYLNTAPGSITLQYGPQGKPALPGDPLHFNLSHAGDRALYAFSATHPIGIDIEAIRPLPDLLSVARTAFSAEELKALETFPAHEQHDVFFRFWTRKEAFIKALGEGLSYDLDRFSVSLEDPARLLHLDGNAGAASQWTLHHFDLHSDYVGALATRQPNPRILFADAARFPW